MTARELQVIVRVGDLEEVREIVAELTGERDKLAAELGHMRRRYVRSERLRRRGDESSRRCVTLGRLSLYVEPRDVWVGLYVSPGSVFVCPLPMVVIRWRRR
jgi:hypothetical protein